MLTLVHSIPCRNLLVASADGSKLTLHDVEERKKETRVVFFGLVCAISQERCNLCIAANKKYDVMWTR
jgi:hypothetical protein